MTVLIKRRLPIPEWVVQPPTLCLLPYNSWALLILIGYAAAPTIVGLTQRPWTSIVFWVTLWVVLNILPWPIYAVGRRFNMLRVRRVGLLLGWCGLAWIWTILLYTMVVRNNPLALATALVSGLLVGLSIWIVNWER